MSDTTGSATGPLLELASVTKIYGKGGASMQALRGIDLVIEAGEFVAIMGASGSGKSTLLNIMGGMDTPTTGQVIFDGEDIGKSSDSQTVFRRREVGFVFQFYNLVPDLTARENVELAANLVDKPRSTVELLNEVGLGDRIDHFPSQMSGGEQQRVSIARAAVKNARLLLCDEPTGALDTKTGKIILSMLKKINQSMNTTVVIVTHNTAIAAMADRVVHMSSGRIEKILENSSPAAPEGIDW